MKTYLQPATDLPVLGNFDGVVCGGGPAGCAAAVAPSRHGARALLAEREGYLGGAPCTQNVVPVLSTNGVDFQGVWHECARGLRCYGGIPPIDSGHRCGTTWFAGSTQPEAIKLVWDELLSDAGAQILHFAQVSETVVGQGVIKGVLLQTQAGRAVVPGCAGHLLDPQFTSGSNSRTRTKIDPGTFHAKEKRRCKRSESSRFLEQS